MYLLHFVHDLVYDLEKIGPHKGWILVFGRPAGWGIILELVHLANTIVIDNFGRVHP